MQARFLLPFTHNIDRGALAYAVHFVRLRQAVLVPLALIPLIENSNGQKARVSRRSSKPTISWKR